ncbi:MAG TPA: hypothetical protein PLF42_05125 [Anaerolineales bacterium]|nr:hypothetical protein [Anaerolineales bacterium]
MDYSKNMRLVFMLASAVDILLGAIALLIYFGILPVEISNWGIPAGFLGLSAACCSSPASACSRISRQSPMRMNDGKVIES